MTKLRSPVTGLTAQDSNVARATRARAERTVRRNKRFICASVYYLEHHRMGQSQTQTVLMRSHPSPYDQAFTGKALWVAAKVRPIFVRDDKRELNGKIEIQRIASAGDTLYCSFDKAKAGVV